MPNQSKSSKIRTLDNLTSEDRGFQELPFLEMAVKKALEIRFHANSEDAQHLFSWHIII